MTDSYDGGSTEAVQADEQRIALRALGELNRLAALGIDGVGERLERLDDYSASAETTATKAGYLDEAALEREFGTVERVGARVELLDAPHGYVVVLFPVESANNAAALMLSNTLADVESASAEMARDALTELSGIVASGYLDAWAREFDREIALAEPTPVHNTEREIVSRTAGEASGLGTYLAAGFRLPEHGVTAKVYLLPEDAAFAELVR